MQNTSAASETLRIVGYVEDPMGLVRDCLSGDPDRHLHCAMSHVVGSTSAILMPLVLLVGLTGNCIVAKVMLTSKKLQRSRQNLYIGCIAIADNLNLLVVILLHGFLSKGLSWLTGGRFGFYLYNLSEIWCKVCRYSVNFCQLLSSLWLLLLVTDRALAVHRPLAMKQAGRFGAKLALGATFAASALVVLPVGFLVGNGLVQVTEGTALLYCSIQGDHTQRWLMLFYIPLTSNPPTLPILAMLTLNVFLAWRVVAALRVRRSLQGRGRGGEINDLSGTILIIILAVVYLVLCMPHLILHPWLKVSMETLDMAANIDYLKLLSNLTYSSKSLALINQATNFFVLLNRNADFRRQVGSMFCCLRRRPPAADDSRASGYRLRELEASTQLDGGQSSAAAQDGVRVQ